MLVPGGNSNLFWCLNNSSDQALGRPNKTRWRDILILETNWDRCHNDWRYLVIRILHMMSHCILKCFNIFFTVNKSFPVWSLPCFSSGGSLANSDWRSVASRANDSQGPKRNGNVKTKTGMLTAIMGSDLVQTAKHSHSLPLDVAVGLGNWAFILNCTEWYVATILK